MYNHFSIYSFFVPEFIETQRTSFLKLLKEDIPSELEKHNPIELNIQQKSLIDTQLTASKQWLPTTFKNGIEIEPFLSSNRVQLNKHSAENVKILQNYLTIDNYLVNSNTVDEINPELNFKWKNNFLQKSKKYSLATKSYYHNQSNITNTMIGKNAYFLQPNLQATTTLTAT